MEDLQEKLKQAIESKNFRFVEKLVHMGADLNEPFGPIGTTPFMYALNEFKKAEQIEKLMDMGANPNTRNKHGETPLMFAVDDEGCEAVVPWVMVDCGLKSLDTQDIWGNTALIRVLLNPSMKPTLRKKLIYALIDYGADLTNLKNNQGKTAWDIIWEQMNGKGI